MKSGPTSPIPSWLETPPRSTVNPPIETRQQELPFGELTWEDFEKLCLRLARLEADVEHCQLYGERGQDQEGIDLYARRRSTDAYTVYQCKREKAFGAAKIEEAVSKFLENEWADKSDTFVLCTKESLVETRRAKAIEAQSSLLKARNITLVIWDSGQLSVKLKKHPEIVDDFFSREWVKVFCGAEQAASLGKRLDAERIIEFRGRLAALYRHIFSQHDPGLPLPTASVGTLSLEERYVMPEIDDQQFLLVGLQPTDAQGNISYAQPATENHPRIGSSDIITKQNRLGDIARRQSISYRHRHVIENWLATHSRNIILGGPGSGKSTLLRFLAIDLLQDEPRHAKLAQKWGRHLPVWIPFGLWTKMISDSPINDSSLSDLMHSWLKVWGEENLWPLVEQTLEDKRLLLLVDGLDEWTDERAAGVALHLLQVFIRQRDLPAVVTSRPHGFNRLGFHTAGWHIGELSDFSTAQQKQLSRIWFTFWINSQNRQEITSAINAEQIERRIDAETEGFITELQGSSDLSELGKVPLLLCLLIAHRLFNVRLPHNRFKAYETLTEHLISTHPQRRRTAVFLTGSTSELGDEEVKRILSHLAFHIHDRFKEGVIDQREAIAIVEHFLADKEHGVFGFESFKARKFGQEIIDAGENTIGLLVKRSATEIGFFHRSFQEYLAAFHISGMPLAEQLIIVQDHCADPHWREVILGLLHVNGRAEEIKQFVSQIRGKEVNSAERFGVDGLLCEIAFGEFNLPITLARELAESAFNQIELGSWMPHREHLLNCVLGGLRSTKIKDLIQTKLQSWFPQRSWWQRDQVFAAMAGWPRLPEVVKCLWKGFHDEDVRCQRAAAKSLAELAAGDKEIGERMASLAWSAVDPKVKAAAIEGLLHGWPDNDRLGAIVDSARESCSPDLRLIAIIARVKRNGQDDEDQKELFYLGTSQADLHYHWKNEISTALLTGWPQSSVTKEYCFKAIKAPQFDGLELDFARYLLLAGFPQDEEVAEFCAAEIKSNQPWLLLSHKYAYWQLLHQNFKDHPLVVAAIDEWLPKQDWHHASEITEATLVGRTTAAISTLMSLLGSQYAYIVTDTLVKGSGLQDTKVAEVLGQIAFGPNREAAGIAHLLPRVIEDKDACRNRLVELLEDPDCEKPESVRSVLESLEGAQAKIDEVDAFMEQAPRSDYRRYGILGLIERYPEDERVKRLAKSELSERDGYLGTVASVYGEDADIRRMIINIACPLPASLRRIIAARLGEWISDEEFSLSLLGFYDYDDDDEVKTTASISYHACLKRAGREINLAVDTLSRDIVSAGPDYKKRRQAAFAGLATFGRLEVMGESKETGYLSGRPCHVPVTGYLSPNIPLLKLILQHWTYIKATLGNGLWTQLTDFSSGPEPLAIWAELCLFADEYPAARDEALSYLASVQGRHPNFLHFISRVRPKSRLLLEYCLQTLGGGEIRNNYERKMVMMAAELLGEHFGGDVEVLKLVITGRDLDQGDESLILTLCEGWPKSEELDHVYEWVKEHKPPLSNIAYFQLICRKGASHIVFRAFLKALADFERNHYLYVIPIIRPVIRRIQTDEELFSALMERLQKNPGSSEKATIPRLISSARGVSSELRTWCVEEIERQLNGQKSPDVGLDLISGELRPIAYSLLDALRPH
jgi:NACHT domain